MKINDTQELLPPESEAHSRFPAWLDWLIRPEPDRFLLPATGLLILGLDWFLFPKEAVTVGLATPFTAVFGFLAGSIGAYQLQRRFGLNTKGAALVKALAAGFLVGVPFPLAGTIVGGWILATSGLADWKRRLWSQTPLRK